MFFLKQTYPDCPFDCKLKLFKNIAYYCSKIKFAVIITAKNVLHCRNKKSPAFTRKRAGRALYYLRMFRAR